MHGSAVLSVFILTVIVRLVLTFERWKHCQQGELPDCLKAFNAALIQLCKQQMNLEMLVFASVKLQYAIYARLKETLLMAAVPISLRECLLCVTQAFVNVVAEAHVRGACPVYMGVFYVTSNHDGRGICSRDKLNTIT